MPSVTQMLEKVLPGAAAAAKRLRNAAEIGFDTSTQWFHGTPSNITEFRLGEDSLMHFGTRDQANARLSWIGKSEGAQVIPVFLRAKKSVRIPDLGHFDPARTAKALEKSGVLTRKEAEAIYPFGEMGGNISQQKGMSQLKEILKSKGYDSFIYRNESEISEAAKGIQPLQDSVAVFDPSQVRSIHAKFDPEARESGALLAGGVGATALMMADAKPAHASDFPSPIEEAKRDIDRAVLSPGSEIQKMVADARPEITPLFVDELIGRSLGRSVPGSSVLNYIAAGRQLEAGAEPSVGLDDMLGLLFPIAKSVGMGR